MLTSSTVCTRCTATCKSWQDSGQEEGGASDRHIHTSSGRLLTVRYSSFFLCDPPGSRMLLHQ